MWHHLYNICIRHPNTPLFLVILAVTAAIISTPISLYFRKRFLKTYIITFPIIFTLLSLLNFRKIPTMVDTELGKLLVMLVALFIVFTTTAAIIATIISFLAKKPFLKTFIITFSIG